LLDGLAAEGPIPAGGAAAAISAAMAASLVGLTARSSPEWEGAGGALAQVRVLRTRLMSLALADSEAYARVLDVLRSDDGLAEDERDIRLGFALGRAAALPLAIAEAAADTVELAAHAAEECVGTVRGDVLAAAVLAESAVRVAVDLVEINLATGDGDPRVLEVRAVAADAARAARRAKERG
jgi:methenyltetrahydrofolate cyclohydrolase